MSCLRTVLILWLTASCPLVAAANTLKIASVAPDGTPWMREMRRGAEEVAERTAGRVKFRFYPGGVMGNDRNVLRKVRIGQLQGGAMTGIGLAELFADTQVYTIPFAFRSHAEVDYVRSRMDAYLLEGLEAAGFVGLGFGESGFAYLLSSDPLRELEDLRGRKIWVPEGDRIIPTMFETMGISPILLPITDVLTGLQTGLVDTVGASPIGAIALQWHTRVRFLTDAPLVFIYGGLMVDRRAFSRLADKDQAVVREVMTGAATRLNRLTREDNLKARGALQRQGIEFVTPSPQVLTRLRATAAEAADRLAEDGVFSKQALQELRRHLADYRRSIGEQN